MSTQRIFKCPITKYYVEYILIDNQCALINTIICDYVNYKAFFALLRHSIDKLKDENIKCIQQFVHDEEWELFLLNKTSWKIININKDDDIYLLECAIDDFLENYSIGIGLTEQ